MASADIVINPSVLKKCIGGNERAFVEAIENAASVNTKLCIERRLRLPFLDSQTGVAQNHTTLWHPYKDRQQGQCKGQLYCYPVKRWKKKKRLAFMNTECKKASDIETGEADMHQISTVENPAIRMEEDKNELSKDAWYDDYDEIDEPPDAGEMVDDQSDISDYEETYIKRRKKKGPGRGRRKNVDKDKDLNPEEREKPYACEVCNARYKTRPGLSYHYNHFHNGVMDDQELSQSPKPQRSSRSGEFSSKPQRSSLSSDLSSEPQRSSRSASKSNVVDDKISANNYCDFCLGDSTENKKTEMPEELVSCSDCGRSGHPTCLQFTQNMIVSVKKYPWQCIECKSCGLCGTSDNDDQLLFCDDCDRGYHMYCLNPPLTSPPDGNWSCHLCIEEFHGGKKPEGMQ